MHHAATVKFDLLTRAWPVEAELATACNVFHDRTAAFAHGVQHQGLSQTHLAAAEAERDKTFVLGKEQQHFTSSSHSATSS
jgi:hypothetical protein